MSIFGPPNVDELLAKRDVEKLIEALGYEDASVRRSAAEALGEIGDARAVEPLLVALKDHIRSVRTQAGIALRGIGDPAVEPLLMALQDDDSSVRSGAANALGGTGDARAVEPLLIALKDDHHSVRLRAAIALGKIGDARAVSPLLTKLRWAQAEKSKWSRHSGPSLEDYMYDDSPGHSTYNMALAERHKKGAMYQAKRNRYLKTEQAVGAALAAISGDDFGTDADLWDVWWEAQGPGQQ